MSNPGGDREHSQPDNLEQVLRLAVEHMPEDADRQPDNLSMSDEVSNNKNPWVTVLNCVRWRDCLGGLHKTAMINGFKALVTHWWLCFLNLLCSLEEISKPCTYVVSFPVLNFHCLLRTIFNILLYNNVACWTNCCWSCDQILVF